MTEEILAIYSLIGFGVYAFTVVTLVAIYNFRELNIKKERDLKAIEALKSNVQLKLNSKDLKNIFK